MALARIAVPETAGGVGVIFGTTSVVSTWPLGYTPTAGHLAVWLVWSKHRVEATVPTASAGHAQLGTVLGGVTGSGSDLGKVRLTVFTKQLAGGDTAPTFTLGAGTGDVLACSQPYVYSKGSGDFASSLTGFDYPTSTLSWSAVSSGIPDWTTGDELIIAHGTTSDAPTGLGSRVLTGTGLTIGTTAEQNDAPTTNGDQMRIADANNNVTAGPVTSTVTLGVTLTGTASTGVGAVVRVREATAVKAAADTGTLSDATAGLELDARTDSATLTESQRALGLDRTDAATLSETAAANPPLFGVETFTLGETVVVGPGSGDSFGFTESARTISSPVSASDTLTASEISGLRKVTDWSPVFSGTTVAGSANVAASEDIAVAEAAASTSALVAVDAGALDEPTRTGTAAVAATQAVTLGEVALAGQVVLASDTGTLSEDGADTLIADAAPDIILAGEVTLVVGPQSFTKLDTFTLSQQAAGSNTQAATDTGTLTEGSALISLAQTPGEALALLEAPAAILSQLVAADAAAATELSLRATLFVATDSAALSESPGIVLPFVPPDIADAVIALDDLMNVWFKARAAGATTADAMLAYFRARSGLPANRSLTDHMAAYYTGGLGSIRSGTPITDLEIAFWKAVDPTNTVGSWAQRARRFYGA